MIAVNELRAIPVFACLSEQWQQSIAESAAELFLTEGEWVIREGEAPSFFVLLDGALACEKDYGGTDKVSACYAPGDFYGEIPILLDSAAIASLKATAPSRVMRLDRLQFKDMLRSNERCSRLVAEVMTRRLKLVSDHLGSNDACRVHVFGSIYNNECREIRAFLSQNDVPYRWSDCDDEMNVETEPFVVVDHQKVVARPLTVRSIADALGMRTTPSRPEYDLAIVGGGPAGLAAALCGSSEGLSVLLIEKESIGGQAARSSRIENYPGFPAGIAGSELGSRASKQAERFGTDIVVTREARGIHATNSGFRLEMDGGCQVNTRSILITTGVQWRKLDAPGLEPLTGRGVCYGAVRAEASNVIGKKVFVVGSGNSAGQAALYLSDFAASVTVLMRGRRIGDTMSQYLADRLDARANVDIEVETTVLEAHGIARLEALSTVADGIVERRQADALFVMVGAIAASNWLPAAIQRDQNRFILTGRDVITRPGAPMPFALETSVPGIFCAGDIRHGSIKRVASGMGEGSMAIAIIHQYFAMREALDAGAAA